MHEPLQVLDLLALRTSSAIPGLLLSVSALPWKEEELLGSAGVEGIHMCVPTGFPDTQLRTLAGCGFLPGLAGHQPLPPEAGLLANYDNHWASAGAESKAFHEHQTLRMLRFPG